MGGDFGNRVNANDLSAMRRLTDRLLKLQLDGNKDRDEIITPDMRRRQIIFDLTEKIAIVREIASTGKEKTGNDRFSANRITARTRFRMEGRIAVAERMIGIYPVK